MINNIKKEISTHKFLYALLAIVLLIGTYFRVYRTGFVLGFYFDQGRDAMEIWELLHKRDFFLIGPTTGIAGIFRGPFYYYLIAPFYWLGGGNPVWPANFLALTAVTSILVLYYLTKETVDRTTGLFAVVLTSLSFYFAVDARWLSNPTPMFLLSMLLLWSMFLVLKGKRWAWISISFLSGLSLFHFGSSGEFFYFPAIIIFAIWQRKHFPTKKILAFSAIAFLLTVSPLVLFDLKNDLLLFNNIKLFMFSNDTFKSSFSVVLQDRLDLYSNTFLSKFFPSGGENVIYLNYTIGILFLYYLPEMIKNKRTVTALLMLFTPMVGLLFFQGNEVYGYYLTGYTMIFVFIYAITLRFIWKSLPGKALVLFLFFIFLSQNVPIIRSKINDGVDGPGSIVLGNQKQILNWIYEDANGESFSNDVYVPPVIPHAYNYLFTWYEMDRNGLVEEQIPLLYTIYEIDPPHPERLEAWMERQKGIGEVEYEFSSGGITVQRRKRI